MRTLALTVLTLLFLALAGLELAASRTASSPELSPQPSSRTGSTFSEIVSPSAPTR